MSTAETSDIRVLIVDDHALVREGLQSLIGKQPGMVVCGEAEDEFRAIQLVEETNPTVLLVDLSLKSGNGIELIKQVLSRHKQVRVLVSSMHDEDLYAERALQAGALGYLNKQEGTHKLIEGIRTVAQGEIFLSDRMSRRILSRIAGKSDDRMQTPVEGLTNRELQVFEFLGQGLNVRQIAGKLDLSPKTIERYRENIKQKLNLASANDLLRYATRWVLENM